MAGSGKVLISGKSGKLRDAVIGALGGRSGFATESLPPGPRLLELVESGRCAGMIFVVGGEQDLESIRWLAESNSSLPLIAVLPAGTVKLRAELQSEGVAEVIVAKGLQTAELRRLLRKRLDAAARNPLAARKANAAIAADLHGIRSALTAIQGHAELALASTRGASSRRQPLEEIVREVGEIEGLLRRIERKIMPRSPLPAK